MIAALGLLLAIAVARADAGIVIFPETALYPAYVADPRQPRYALRFLTMTRRDIPHAPRSRLGTALGGERSVLRVQRRDGEGWMGELAFGAGFFAQWEEQGRDGIGWDGVYRVTGAWKPAAQWVFRLGVNHVSSHVIDEYTENTGRRRIGYTREEIIIGASWSGNFRVYGEVGYAHLMRSALQEPWRLQAGWESGMDPSGLYMALDVQAHQENDWGLALAAQLGRRWPLRRPGQELRLGLEYYRGRSPLGEFFRAEERQWGVGVWLYL